MRVEVGAGRNEQLHGIDRAGHGGVHQRRFAFAVAYVGVGAAGEQRLQRVEVIGANVAIELVADIVAGRHATPSLLRRRLSAETEMSSSDSRVSLGPFAP